MRTDLCLFVAVQPMPKLDESIIELYKGYVDSPGPSLSTNLVWLTGGGCFAVLASILANTIQARCQKRSNIFLHCNIGKMFYI